MTNATILYDIDLCACCMYASLYAEPCDCPPDAHPDGLGACGDITPDFDSNTGDGITDFGRYACQGCNSFLAGSRYRFAVWGA